MTLPYDKLPEHGRESIQLYIEHGCIPGHFMNAVFANDLFGAIGRADETSLHNLYDYVKWIYRYAPMNCHGDYPTINRWMREKQKEKEKEKEEEDDE